MKEIRTIRVPRKAVCEVKYYIYITHITPDPHFRPDPDGYYKENEQIVLFDTEDEANRVMKRVYKDSLYAVPTVKEIVKPLYLVGENGRMVKDYDY